MSRTPSSNKNLLKAAAVKASGYKTYIHSIVDEQGRGYYAEDISQMYFEGKGAKTILKELIKKYPTVEPPSLGALGGWLKKYAVMTIPTGSANPALRKDAMASMYKALDAVETQLDQALALQAKQKDLPLPMVRQIALNVVQISEKIVQAEKATGVPPIVNMTQNNVTNTQNNVMIAQQTIISDPEKGKELLESFKEFEQQVTNLQGDTASATVTS